MYENQLNIYWSKLLNVIVNYENWPQDSIRSHGRVVKALDLKSNGFITCVGSNPTDCVSTRASTDSTLMGHMISILLTKYYVLNLEYNFYTDVLYV